MVYNITKLYQRLIGQLYFNIITVVKNKKEKRISKIIANKRILCHKYLFFILFFKTIIKQKNINNNINPSFTKKSIRVIL